MPLAVTQVVSQTPPGTFSHQVSNRSSPLFDEIFEGLSQSPRVVSATDTRKPSFQLAPLPRLAAQGRVPEGLGPLGNLFSPQRCIEAEPVMELTQTARPGSEGIEASDLSTTRIP